MLFVVPPSMILAYQKQTCTMNALNRSKMVVSDEDSVKRMDALFEQWVMSA